MFKIGLIHRIFHIDGISKALSTALERSYELEDNVFNTYLLEQLINTEDYKLTRYKALKQAKKLLKFCNENGIDEFYYKDEED